MIDFKSLIEQIDRWYYQDVGEVLMVVQAGLACYYNRFPICDKTKSTGKNSEDWEKTHNEKSYSLKLSPSKCFVSSPTKSFTQTDLADSLETATCQWMNEFRSPQKRKDSLFFKMVEAPPTFKRFVSPLLKVVEEKEDSPSRVHSPTESMNVSSHSKQSSRASSPCDDSFPFSSPVIEMNNTSRCSTPSETVNVDTLSLESFDNPFSSEIDVDDKDEDPELDEHDSLLILLARPWWRRNSSPCQFTAEKFKVITEAESKSIQLPNSSSTEQPDEVIAQVAPTVGNSLPLYQTSGSSASTTSADLSALQEASVEQTEVQQKAGTNEEFEDVVESSRADINSGNCNTMPCHIPDYLADVKPGTSGLRNLELRILKLQEKEEEKRRKQEIRARQQALRFNPELCVPQIYKFVKEKMYYTDLSNFHKALGNCGTAAAKMTNLECSSSKFQSSV